MKKVFKNISKTCLECNNGFTAHKQTTKFCSLKCNNLNLYKSRDVHAYNARKRINIAGPVARARHFERYKNDVNYRLTCVLRARLNRAIKCGTKAGSAVKDLGCSIAEFKLYIESKFEPGMTWDNWSRNGWHLDHKEPLGSFNLEDQEQLKKACHYTNLQPIWIKDHKIKTVEDIRKIGELWRG
jgi:hypothetical protein